MSPELVAGVGLICYDAIMRRYRSLSAVVLTVLISAVVGGLLGRQAMAQDDRVTDEYRVFTTALAAIEQQYVEPVDSTRLVYGAINGMLRTLDPHSSFMDPRTYAQMRERQKGRYYGLGISIVVVNGDITVMQLFEGSPAYHAGLRRGDIIARIEGEDAQGWTSDQAVRALRGEKGTSVHISIRRAGYAGFIEMDVERDEVNITTVRGAFMVDDGTGYIRLTEFSETSDRELGDALAMLEAQGMRRLVFDLRDNPGGSLDQAIRVANRFLRRGQMVVYTRGRVPNADQDYRATEVSDYVDLPLVVLVNRNSASAAEIVSGAVQDHDRGVIVGERTFGKALVQSVYRLSGGAGLALTTGHYYTPSGRLIQRPWDGSFDEYFTYTLKEQEGQTHDVSDLKYTDGGRKVFGGGGIEPDRFVPGPIEGFDPTRFGRLLYARQLFETYAERFSAQGDTRVAAESQDRRVVARGFTVDDDMLADFSAFAESEGVPIDEAAFAADRRFIRAMIKLQIDQALFGIDEARHNLLAEDPQAQIALGQFGEAERLSQAARGRVSESQH
jgi:carboxyl-terminal processing protease